MLLMVVLPLGGGGVESHLFMQDLLSQPSLKPAEDFKEKGTILHSLSKLVPGVMAANLLFIWICRHICKTNP